MTELIVARSVQGAGAGAMQPMAMTILGDLYGPADRARVQGWFGAVWGTAGLVGPLLGGLIVSVLSWHWVFFINVPFGVASIAVLTVALHEQVEPQRHQLDLAGALLLTVAIVALLLGTGAGARAGMLAVAAVALVLFIVVQLRAPEPVLPLALLRQRVIAVSSATGALIGGAMIGTSTFLPLYVQAVQGGSPTDAGLAIAPMAIGWPIASALCGRLLPRVGYRPLVRLGLLSTLLACVALALLVRHDSSRFMPRITSALLGLGLGFANTTLLVAVQGSVGWKQRGVATASTLLFRMLGGAVAVGALGAILAAALRGDAAVPDGAVSALVGPTHGRGLPPELLNRLSASLAAGLTDVFWSIAAVAGAALALGLLFPSMTIAPEPPASAQQQRPRRS
jgi:MFS family permease